MMDKDFEEKLRKHREIHHYVGLASKMRKAMQSFLGDSDPVQLSKQAARRFIRNMEKELYGG